MKTRFKTVSTLIAAGVLFGVTGIGRASEDHDEAKSLREAGAILPLERILEQAQQHHAGRVVETELERKRDRYVYEIKIVDKDGIVWELKYDAKTAELLKTKQED